MSCILLRHRRELFCDLWFSKIYDHISSETIRERDRKEILSRLNAKNRWWEYILSQKWSSQDTISYFGSSSARKSQKSETIKVKFFYDIFAYGGTSYNTIVSNHIYYGSISSRKDDVFFVLSVVYHFILPYNNPVCIRSSSFEQYLT